MILLLLTLAADVDRLPPFQASAYRLIRPAAGELKWKQIAWQTDLAAAVKLATAEKRPLFVWVAGDPPLERC
jgi:hypothetical protein